MEFGGRKDSTRGKRLRGYRVGGQGTRFFDISTFDANNANKLKKIFKVGETLSFIAIVAPLSSKAKYKATYIWVAKL